jgi:hypothetical protein
MQTTEYSPILDASGNPFKLDTATPNSKSHGSSFQNTYLGALQGIEQPAAIRARDPLSNHAWVFASAMAIAMSASQAPLTVFEENAETTAKRKLIAKNKGRVFSRNYGRRRSIIRRHKLTKDLDTRNRAISKALEPSDRSDIQVLLDNPNELQDSSHFTQTTLLLLSLNGECFWLYTDAEGVPTSYDAKPERMYPISAACMEPIFSNGRTGELIGWWLNAPHWMELGKAMGMRWPIELNMVTQFKFPNPYDPVRGMSPITSAALAIKSDILARSSNEDMLKNGGVPRGVVSYEGHMDPDNKNELETKWKDKFEQGGGQARTAFLPNGMKYAAVGISNKDIQFLEMLKWGREEVLAVMGVPPSVLGVTEFTNYATQLGQDKNFYDKGLLPKMRIIERGLDSTLMLGSPDDEVILFDLTEVEALRAGLMDKVTIANQLMADKPHMPPKVAFELVGIESEEYEGDDIAFITPMLTSVTDLIKSIEEDPIIPPALEPFAGIDSTIDEDDEEAETADPNEDQNAIDDKEEATVTNRAFHVAKKPNGVKVWRQFMKIELEAEQQMKVRYRRWVKKAKRGALRKLSEFTSVAKAQEEFTYSLESIFDAIEQEAKLSFEVRPLYPSVTEATFALTEAELGIPLFQIDDTSIIEQWAKREKIFTKSIPHTVAKNLGRELQEAFARGETMQEVQRRVATIFDVSATSTKAVTVARTEMSSLMSGIRDEMFELQGIVEEGWSTSLDEKVRDDHVTFGNSGSHPRGFNYLEFASANGTQGILTHPGDSRAPAGQVIRCRCVKYAVK